MATLKPKSPRHHAAAVVIALAVPPCVCGAQATGPIEEVIVTAQRIAESIQDVPIAVTALTEDALDDRQVVTPSDLQINAPNVSFTATNFAGSSFSIRGVGNLVVARSGESGVSDHLNEIAVTTNLNTVEFFDLERVEVLRGPQGTLYGRNATGGAINFVTRKPDMGDVNAYLEIEAGDYDHRRVKGALNLPFGDRLAARLAGFKLDRSGYIENLAYGQVGTAGRTLSGIDADIDGRDILAYRASLKWEINDHASAWGLYARFEEDDDRARITNQVCDRNPLPTSGCTADGFGWDKPNLGSTTAGLFGAAIGALPAGADGSAAGLYEFARPDNLGFRRMHTDFDPVYRSDEEILAFGVEFDVAAGLRASIAGARRDHERLARQDYQMDVGPRLAATPVNPAGIWPTSEPAGGAGAETTSDVCNLFEGTSGILGGCRLGVAQNREFVYDQSEAKAEYWTVEAKVHSSFEGPWGFLAGVSAFETHEFGGYYVLANTLDLVTLYGSPALDAPPLYPGFFYNGADPVEGTTSDGWAGFGEVYYDYSDRLKLTAGLRFNEDNKGTKDTNVLFNSADVNAALGGLLGADPIWLRLELLDAIGALAANPAAPLDPGVSRLLEFHGALGVFAEGAPLAAGTMGAIVAASSIATQVQSGLLQPALIPVVVGTLGLPPLFQTTVLTILSQNPLAIAQDPGIRAGAAALSAIADAVGAAPGFGETRFVTGSPTDSRWREATGRVGFDFQLDDATLIYGFLSRGYKPGGFNPAVPPQFQGTTPFTFDPEQVNALEVGAKSTRMDGRLVLNGAIFYSDYAGLQTTRIRNNTSINENIDADITGLEIEGMWRAPTVPLAVDFAYGWLNTAVDGSRSIDPINRTGGSPDYILLNNIDPGAVTAVNYVARESEITAAVVGAALARGAALDIRNGATVQSVSYPANAAGVSIPAYFSREFLTALGVETLDGVPVSLDGNSLPNAPEHTVRLGVSYTFRIAAADLTARWDAYWQSDSYAREFNTVGDEIDGWMQHNASLTYERAGWTAKVWVRNIADDENVTGKYLTTDTSGFFRNYFLTEPRIYGLSLRYTYGE